MTLHAPHILHTLVQEVIVAILFKSPEITAETVKSRLCHIKHTLSTYLSLFIYLLIFCINHSKRPKKFLSINNLKFFQFFKNIHTFNFVMNSGMCNNLEAILLSVMSY